MLGAIVGDIVGSRFEFDNHRSKDFELFTPACEVTDDSIMTLAVAKAIMRTDKQMGAREQGERLSQGYCDELGILTVKHMQEIGRKYPGCGYGNRFFEWVFSKEPKPYQSYGNGAAMRISPAGFVAKTEAQVFQLAETITSVTHNHEEGLKGGSAVALAVFLARHGSPMNEIKSRMAEYYDLDFKIDDIRSSYKFDETCQGTVPQALNAFFESDSFEDAIRNAISLGGDSDTIAAITGSIADAFYGVPDPIRDSALFYLDNELWGIYTDWNIYFSRRYQDSPAIMSE